MWRVSPSADGLLTVAAAASTATSDKWEAVSVFIYLFCYRGLILQNFYVLYVLVCASFTLST